MKTVMKLFAALAVILMFAGGCGSSPSAKADELDTAIRETSDYLNSNIPRGSKIVILNIQSDYPGLSEYIIDELIANAVTDRIFSVVDRRQLDVIRAEQNFQLSGEVDDNSAIDIGKLFGAQTIVSGAMGRLGNGYRMRIRALEVQTAQVQGQFNRNIASSLIIAALIESGGGSSSTAASGITVTASGLTISGLSSYRDRYVMAVCILDDESALFFAAENVTRNFVYTAGRIRGDSITLGVWRIGRDNALVRYNGNDKNMSFLIYIVDKAQITTDILASSLIERRESNVNFNNGAASVNYAAAVVISGTPAAPVTPATPRVYRIGDTGPAGGLIFYDKGNNSSGWRYLEAAPVEAESQAVWSARSTRVENTQVTIGSGRRNTQLIVEKFRQTAGEWDTAAQKCDELVFGGFDDWFLPSRDELDQMYGNLKRRNLGNFKEAWYYSSSGVGSESNVISINFQNGYIDASSGTSNGWPSRRLYVRPIRQVPGP